MTSLHFILDYETIGQDVFTAPIVNCSYFLFDWSRFTSDDPYTFEELVQSIQFSKFNIKEQHEEGYRVKNENLEWWKDQGSEALKQLKPSPSDTSVSTFVATLISYLKNNKISRWWSRSNTFDPILLHRNFRDYSTREELDRILPYWLVRDIRTYIDTRFDLKNKVNGFCPFDDENEWNRVFIKHNSIHDVAADILRLQRIERIIHSD